MAILAHERRGSGEPLVLVHGIGSQWQVWEPVLDTLARERDVIAVDLPGFGGSPPTGEDPMTPGAHAAAVMGLLDELGLEAAHVAGNSLGGGIALEVGRAGRARSVSCLSPVGFWNEREHAYSRASLRMSVSAARALSPMAPLVCATPVGRALAFGQMAARPWRIPAPEAVATLRNLARSPGFEPTLAGFTGWRFRDGAELRCPVTIAWGQRDRLLIPRQANRARRALPQARHVTLTGCGHVPTWDDPEQVANVLLEGSAG